MHSHTARERENVWRMCLYFGLTGWLFCGIAWIMIGNKEWTLQSSSLNARASHSLRFISYVGGFFSPQFSETSFQTTTLFTVNYAFCSFFRSFSPSLCSLSHRFPPIYMCILYSCFSTWLVCTSFHRIRILMNNCICWISQWVLVFGVCMCVCYGFFFVRNLFYQIIETPITLIDWIESKQ